MPHVNDPEGRSPSDPRAVSLPPSGRGSHCLAPCEAPTLVSRGVRPRTDARAPGVWEGRGLEMVRVRMRTSSGTPTPTVPDTDVYADAQGSPSNRRARPRRALGWRERGTCGPGATDSVSFRGTETRTYGSLGRISRHLPARRGAAAAAAWQNGREREAGSRPVYPHHEHLPPPLRVPGGR